MEIEEDMSPAAHDNAAPSGTPQPIDEDTQKHVMALLEKVREDELHHKKAFERMRRNMRIAARGADKDWPANNYTANIIGRHIKRKTAALYAKNPRIVARRRDTLDFAVWDENPQTLMMAQQAVAMAGPPPAPMIDPMTGMPAPVMDPTAEQRAVLDDFTQGMRRREQVRKLGKTLEILYAHSMMAQQPIDFKAALKNVVRRACVNSVGYVKPGFERITEPPQAVQDQMNDIRERMDHIQLLVKRAGDGDKDLTVELRELELTLQGLQQAEHVVVREGLVFDYPLSTNVIPDKLTRELAGFVGARHLTLRYYYTKDEVEARFKVDLGDQYKEYTIAYGDKRAWPSAAYVIEEDDYPYTKPENRTGKMVCVYEHYDRVTGLVYLLADGYRGYLAPPAPPNVFVEGFWPVHALTFNQVESEDELFPPSDVELLEHAQREYNRARQGVREHRDAARPRWVFANGAFPSEEDPMRMQRLRPFEALGINVGPGFKLSDVLQAVPISSPDPNLYDTGYLFGDIQLIGGTQEALLGGVAKATATESTIAASATKDTDSADIDELDSFLTRIAKDCGVILLKEMTPEQVMKIAGAGAVWPGVNMDAAAPEDVIGDVYLEVEAGSTGKPNAAVEIDNFQKLAPFLLQIPGINPEFLAREALRRMDDRLDLTEAVVPALPSIVMMNQQAQPGFADGDPNAQGPEGGNNVETPSEPPGSEAAFGSNQV